MVLPAIFYIFQNLYGESRTFWSVMVPLSFAGEMVTGSDLMLESIHSGQALKS